MSQDQRLPPEKLAQLRQLVHSHVSGAGIQEKIRACLADTVAREGGGGGRAMDEDALLEALEEKGLIDEVMASLDLGSCDTEGVGVGRGGGGRGEPAVLQSQSASCDRIYHKGTCTCIYIYSSENTCGLSELLCCIHFQAIVLRGQSAACSSRFWEAVHSWTTLTRPRRRRVGSVRRPLPSTSTSEVSASTPAPSPAAASQTSEKAFSWSSQNIAGGKKTVASLTRMLFQSPTKSIWF